MGVSVANSNKSDAREVADGSARVSDPAVRVLCARALRSQQAAFQQPKIPTGDRVIGV